MAYPPAALPTNRTNATPQQDTHPADHNTIGQAVNDVVTELGANPSGVHADVGTRFNYESNRSTLGTTADHFNDFAGFIIQATSTVVNVDGNGNAVVTFPHPFHDVPIVLVSQGDYASRGMFLSSSSPSTTSFTLTATIVNTAAPPPNGTPIRVNWIGLSIRTS